MKLIVALVLIANFANYGLCSKEFVPVFMLESTQSSDSIPALHKISKDSFKDSLLERLRTNPFVVIFEEETLSPEDFIRKENGQTVFGNLQSLRETTSVTYRPFVQSPLEAVNELGRKVVELSLEAALEDDFPQENVLLIKLNDAQETEERTELLKRHDQTIAKVFKDLSKKHSNILAIYTASHSSWISAERSLKRRARSLLQTAAAPSDPPISTNGFMFYTNGEAYYQEEGKTEKNVLKISDAASASISNGSVIVSLAHEQININFTFRSGYWTISSFKLNDTVMDVQMTIPKQFSYHCKTFKAKSTGKGKKYTLVIPGFQFQPALGSIENFGDAYDCVGFTTIPIWTGIFVTLLMLIILTYGITLIMDIRTMDRFDDPKGKTIIINAE